MVTQGDIIFISMDPQKGSEQAGYRPAMIVSNDRLNRVSKVVLACPVTNTGREYPTHVVLSEKMTTTGEVMCEQIKALDLSVREYRFLERAPQEVIDEVVEVLTYILEKPDV